MQAAFSWRQALKTELLYKLSKSIAYFILFVKFSFLRDAGILIPIVKAAIIVLDARYAAMAQSAERILKKAGKVLGLTNTHCAVYIVDDARMETVALRARHARHTGINVLAFPAVPDFPRPDLGSVRDVGEIYINPGHIIKKKENVSFMLIHGLLHLAGYDHKEKHDTLAMEAKEKELMRILHD